MKTYFDKLSRIDPVNRTHLERYVRHLELKQLSPRTIETKLWRTYYFLQTTGFKDAVTITQDDVEDYFIQRRKTCSPATVNGTILELRLFFRWLSGKDTETALFQNIRMNRHLPTLPTDRLLTRADVQKLVDVCDRPRDRALVMLLWDSGARIGEIVTLDVGHVEFDRYGAVVIVNGKTGRRRIRLISSAPDLQTWLNQHPLRTNAAAPLFTTYNRYGAGTKRLNLHTVQNALKTIARRAGITKPVHPHAFRHARLTDLAKQGFSEMELRIIAGWEKNSAMPEVYVHLSGGDIEKKMLEKAGFVAGDETPGTTALEPRECPRCHTMNTYDALYCRACSMALTEHAAYQVEEKTEEAEKSDEYQDLLNRLRRDLGVNL